MIDWKAVQTRLTVAGRYTGRIEGNPGPLTFASIFSYAAGRGVDTTLQAIACAAASPDQGLAPYGINDTPQRLAEFIAQTATESGGYTRFEENLRYSAARLMAVWPRRFPTLASAQPYAANATALADLVYGGRMGNERNGIADDDGWNYRGRGLIQITGRDNYAKFGPLIGTDLLKHPELAADPAISLRIACEFWKAGGINTWVDKADFYAARSITNTGQPHSSVKPIGLDDVAARRKHLLLMLSTA